MEQRLLQALLSPSVYPEPTGSVGLIQTHVSYIFLTDQHVYKIKKPVDFGFLNFTTLDRRRFYCNEEVRLNRRLSPDLYLGVVEIHESENGVAIEGDGLLVDYAVKMRRLPAERMLDRLLAEDRVRIDDMIQIARTVARFHLEAERSDEINQYGDMHSIRRNWEENFQQAGQFTDALLATADLQLIREWVDAFLADNVDLIRRRMDEGHIRDCDGDIHLENICLADKVYIFDCIEFNNRFRYSDTAADIAFLLMDLEFHCRRDLARVFLDEYVTATGDRQVCDLLAFYQAYRAFIRGKVESFRLLDPQIPPDDQQAAMDKAQRYFRLSRGYTLRGRLEPTLVITCGLMGSGKSHIAAELAFQLGIDTVNSDVVRKGLAAGTGRGAGYAEGLYTPAFDRATYDKLLAMAEQALGTGQSIIVDATFRRRADRQRFRALAGRFSVPFIIIRTECDEQTIRKRLTARAGTPGEISDGRWELFPRQRDEFEPVATEECDRLIICDTARPVADSVNDILTSMGILQCGHD